MDRETRGDAWHDRAIIEHPACHREFFTKDFVLDVQDLIREFGFRHFFGMLHDGPLMKPRKRIRPGIFDAVVRTHEDIGPNAIFIEPGKPIVVEERLRQVFRSPVGL